MAGISKYTTESLITKLMHNATTSNYYLSINLPGVVSTYIGQKKNVLVDANLRERINISCTDATLPGSSFATHDVTSDFMGVTEKMAYRRMYDETMSVSMIVDPEYKTLHFFEGWMDYIAGKQINNRGSNDNYKNFRNGFRMNYPDGDNGEGYRSQNLIELYKFEKDTTTQQSIKYTMIEGYPISMNPMDISYGATDLLKLTVNFTFVRYVTEPFKPGENNSPDVNNQSPVPTLLNSLLSQNFLNFRPGDGKINPELNLGSQNIA
tara:strand:+ start:398 stop:1192 length:795 start_codon:yes stop_codon:yes gene_type:complete